LVGSRTGATADDDFFDFDFDFFFFFVLHFAHPIALKTAEAMIPARRISTGPAFAMVTKMQALNRNSDKEKKYLALTSSMPISHASARTVLRNKFRGGTPEVPFVNELFILMKCVG
jgi:hypothetical protein